MKNYPETFSRMAIAAVLWRFSDRFSMPHLHRVHLACFSLGAKILATPNCDASGKKETPWDTEVVPSRFAKGHIQMMVLPLAK